MPSSLKCAALAACVAAVCGASPVKRIVVLMFENRAFDHMLGYLSQENPEIDGLPVGVPRCNPTNPLEKNSPEVCVNFNAIDGGPDDPCHSFDCITQQTFGFNKSMDDKKSPALMDGFAANAAGLHASVPFVFTAHNSTNLPVLSALAREFALFDSWHVSCPCPTNPNREFLSECASEGDRPVPCHAQSRPRCFSVRHGARHG